mgnify:CR=1 FL=1
MKTRTLPVITPDAARQFWAKVDRSGDSCWLWRGYIGENGYGHCKISGRCMAHRLAYELAWGPIGDGLHIDHLCKNRRCVNPNHLEAVTPRENNLRSASPAWVTHRTGIHQSECRSGHPLSGDNLYLFPDGRRGCRACQRANRKRWKDRAKQVMEVLA